MAFESPAVTTGFPAGIAIFDDEQQREDAEAERHRHAAMIASLEPPISGSELYRDKLLRFLDSPLVQWLGILVFVLIVLDDLLFLTMLMGWQTLCDTPSPTDCAPRNGIYNYSVQLLNLLFTYIALVSFPWRCTQFLHTSGWARPARANDAGCNVYGIPNDPDIWCYIPVGRRLGITCVLLFNCITQFLNQASRVVYNTYDLQNQYPGTLWTNVFFGLSLGSGFLGLFWVLYEMGRVRMRYPGCFGPGPVDTVRMICQTSPTKKDSVRGLIRYASNPDIHNRRILPKRKKNKRKQTHRRAMRVSASKSQPEQPTDQRQQEDGDGINGGHNLMADIDEEEHDESKDHEDIEAMLPEQAIITAASSISTSTSSNVIQQQQQQQLPALGQSQSEPLQQMQPQQSTGQDEIDDPDRLAEFVASVTRHRRQGTDWMRSSADPTRNTTRGSVLGWRTSRTGPRLFGL